MSFKRACQGFSLVELMVGVVIAMIASVVMFQVFAVSERQKRTTTGAADALTNGATALYMIERDVRMAGFNLLGSAFADCNPASIYTYYDGGGGATPTPIANFMVPIVITDGGTGPDQINIPTSASDFDPNFTFGRTNLRSTMPQPSSELNVESTHGCAVGSMLLMVQPCVAGSTAAGSCTLMQITQVQDSALKIQHNPGGTPTYNPPASYQNTNNWPAYQMNSSCKAYGICMPAPTSAGATLYSIKVPERRLEVAKGAAAAVSIAPYIMDMQAEYGLSATPAGAITSWQAATGSWAGTLTKAQANQIKAIRIALVARSGEYEKPADGVNCDTTTTTLGLSTWATFDASTWPADWKCYRYKVFETVIPLRNVIWANV